MSVLLCSDLDRTILPNGAPPESPQARPLLCALAQNKGFRLAYVSGRDLRLLKAAISEYKIPLPNYAIGDVGTTIYEIRQGEWHPWHEWSEEIAPDWAGENGQTLADLFQDLDDLRLQEEEKQNSYKLSYYTPVEIDRDALFAEMESRLKKEGVQANLIWSIDEELNVGLLDVLPKSANKLHAVKFLIERIGIAEEATVFAGDSGNDLPVLTSGLQSVLVRNAHPDVVQEAKAVLHQRNLSDRLYIAKGDFMGMNGNYSAGVVEGVAHFLPEVNKMLSAL